MDLSDALDVRLRAGAARALAAPWPAQNPSADEPGMAAAMLRYTPPSRRMALNGC
ncbi:MAG: hypothetical protein OQK79_02465 [Rhodanobacter sp.]|nr:hypothetical protein [Rhodanobacter sp.]